MPHERDTGANSEAEKQGSTLTPGRGSRPELHGPTGQELSSQQGEKRQDGAHRTGELLPVVSEQQDNPEPNQDSPEDTTDQEHQRPPLCTCTVP